MKKTLLTLGLLVTATTASANDFADDGRIRYNGDWYDFTMQTETNGLFNSLNNKIEARVDGLGASSMAIANLPYEKEKVLVGVGLYGDGKAIAVGYASKLYNKDFKTSLSYDSEGTLSVGLGVAF